MYVLHARKENVHHNQKYFESRYAFHNRFLIKNPITAVEPVGRTWTAKKEIEATP